MWKLAALVLLFPAPREVPPDRDNGHGFMGVTYSQTDDSTGFQVSSVLPDSPAAKSGIQAGDIIVRFQGRLPVDINDFMRMAIHGRPGTVTEVEILRGGENLKLKLTLGRRPSDFPYALPAIEP